MTKAEWQAFQNHDAAYDGRLFCGMISSKAVCRPSCTARMRHPDNVVAFSSLAEAESQGFTPCRHCRPDQPQWQGEKKELVRAAQAYIDAHSAEKFSLKALSGALYINGSYLLRVFREVTGHTLLWYHNHIRCEKAKRLLTQNTVSISAAGEQVGFCSSSHFTHVFHKMEGKTPSEFRKAYYQSLEP